MIYDCIIIGAGPGGLSAAIYLGRAHKKILVVYGGPRRTALSSHIQNYLGFLDISGPELIEKGIEQAKRYGAEFVMATVKKVKKKNNVFNIETTREIFTSKYLVAASGIDDILPGIDNIFEYLGETFFTCLDCDGWHLSGKKVCIIGKGDGAARTALAIKKLYGSEITILSGHKNGITGPYKKRLLGEGIKIMEKSATHINGKNGKAENIVLDDGSILECERILSDLGYERNDHFLSGMNLERSKSGYIETDEHLESSVGKLFAVGPINTGPDQISVAVGEGARAAMRIIESELDLKA